MYNDLLSRAQRRREIPVWFWATLAAVATLVILLFILLTSLGN
jgi:type VI protein secretion system component VasF